MHEGIASVKRVFWYNDAKYECAFEERECACGRDVLTKEYLSDSSRFADLMNVFYFGGTAGDPGRRMCRR